MTRISPNRNRRPVVAIFLAIIVVAILSLFYGVFSTGIWGISAPLLSIHTTMQGFVNGVESPFTSKAALLTENQLLTEALASTTAALADRNLLYQENLDLTNRLGRDGSVPTILATILLRPPALPYDTLVVDVGSLQGVVTGDVVAAGGTTLIGFISQTTSSTSYVTLFSSPGQTYDALLHTTQGISIPIVITGQGGGSLMGKIPSGSMVASGDSIVFPSIYGGFIGTVSSVIAPQNQSFETVYMHEPVNVEQLISVEIWKNHAQ